MPVSPRSIFNIFVPGASESLIIFFALALIGQHTYKRTHERDALTQTLSIFRTHTHTHMIIQFFSFYSFSSQSPISAKTRRIEWYSRAVFQRVGASDRSRQCMEKSIAFVNSMIFVVVSQWHRTSWSRCSSVN